VIDRSQIPGSSNDILTPSGAVTNITQPKDGNVELIDGTLKYTPPSDFKGTVSYTYTETNAKGEQVQVTVNIVVLNQAPVVAATPGRVAPGSSISTPLPNSDPNNDTVVLTLGKPNYDIPVSLVGGSAVVTAPANFSGRIVIPVIATDEEGLTGTTDLVVIVNPAPVTDGLLQTTGPAKAISPNVIVPLTTKLNVNIPQSALSVQVIVNGVVVDAPVSPAGVVTLPFIVGPKDKVQIRAIGADDTMSELVDVPLLKEAISLANVNFATDSYKLDKKAKAILDRVVKTVVAHGFTKVDLNGHTDSDGSMAASVILSKQRSAAVRKYITAALTAAGVKISSKSSAMRDPVLPNNSAAGKANNRRVDINIRP
jgi:outer membrane protein OmpA-like peptidoglycan-associated protein